MNEYRHHNREPVDRRLIAIACPVLGLIAGFMVGLWIGSVDTIGSSTAAFSAIGFFVGAVAGMLALDYLP